MVQKNIIITTVNHGKYWYLNDINKWLNLHICVITLNIPCILNLAIYKHGFNILVIYGEFNKNYTFSKI